MHAKSNCGTTNAARGVTACKRVSTYTPRFKGLAHAGLAPQPEHGCLRTLRILAVHQQMRYSPCKGTCGVLLSALKTAQHISAHVLCALHRRIRSQRVLLPAQRCYTSTHLLSATYNTKHLRYSRFVGSVLLWLAGGIRYSGSRNYINLQHYNSPASLRLS